MEEVTEVEAPAGSALHLMEGGPLHTLQRRLGLIKEKAPGTAQRALFFAALAWVPLLIFCLLSGTAYGDAVRVPFLRDFSIYTRFLVTVPMLVIAEIILGPRVAEATEHFIKAKVVLPADYGSFLAEVQNAERRSSSRWSEAIILCIAYLIAAVTFRVTEVHVSTWYSVATGSGFHMSGAGWWIVLFCLPLFHFLILRWIWRIILWFRFLSKVNELDLQLFPTHPDQSGGLGFVGETQRFFGILLFAYSAGLAGVLADEILYDKIPLKHFAPAIIAYIAIALTAILLPLIIFTPRLLKTKRRGLHQYGTLATAYTGAFHKKWIRKENPDEEPLLGTGDIQSLADLGNSYSMIEKMNGLPVNPRVPAQLLVAAALPMVPLLLTMMPLKDVLKLLFKVLL